MNELLKSIIKVAIEDGTLEQLVTVELFNPVTQEVFSTEATLNADGSIDCEFSEAYTGKVIVCVFAKEGDFLATYSATEVEAVDNVITYDFTTDVSKAFGDNQTLVNGVACFYNGDINQDLSIDSSDVSLNENNPTGFVLTETIIRNSTNSVFAQVPDYIGAPTPRQK